MIVTSSERGERGGDERGAHGGCEARFFEGGVFADDLILLISKSLTISVRRRDCSCHAGQAVLGGRLRPCNQQTRRGPGNLWLRRISSERFREPQIAL